MNVTNGMREMVMAKTSDRCYYCGCKLERETATVDHMQPTSRGGKTELPNLVPACVRCNRAKGQKTPTEFRHGFWCKFDGYPRGTFWGELRGRRLPVFGESLSLGMPDGMEAEEELWPFSVGPRIKVA